MKTHFAILCALIVTLVLLETPPLGRAGSLLLLDLMEETAFNDAVFIDSMFGPSPGSPLTFTSNVDSATNSFSYSINPGTTYEGVGITLTGSGGYNPSSLVVADSSSGNLGSTSWTTSGTGSLSSVGGVVRMTLDEDLFVAAKKKGDVHTAGEFDLDKGTSTQRWYRTDENGKPIPGSAGSEADKYNEKTGKWDKVAEQKPGNDLSLLIVGQGFSPPLGGSGSFTLTISTIPEPPSLTLFGLGALGSLGFAWLLGMRDPEAESMKRRNRETARSLPLIMPIKRNNLPSSGCRSCQDPKRPPRF